MDLFGIEISEVATKWTAIGGVITTIAATIFGIKEKRQNQKLKSIQIKQGKIDNADKLHEIHSEILEGTKISEQHRNTYFINQIKFCEENMEKFIEFVIKNKNNENSNSSRS